MKLAIGCDNAAFALRDVLAEYIRESHPEIELVDFGLQDDSGKDYPDVAITVAEAVASGRVDRALLLCGTGLGVAIAANKVAGVRAATCHDVYSAQRAQLSNDAQIITMGSRVIGPELAKVVLDAYLSSSFAGGKSSGKVDKISAYEQTHR
ncbi:MAG: RpiB/LacA/LacB family sugar-phosphate isomerase [Microbacteriaceae bacterium]|nr:RpiB/LacA/LacB family sugar-phosphate isomerase [Microbacteriaceae bacterium]